MLRKLKVSCHWTLTTYLSQTVIYFLKGRGEATASDVIIMDSGSIMLKDFTLLGDHPGRGGKIKADFTEGCIGAAGREVGCTGAVRL